MHHACWPYQLSKGEGGPAELIDRARAGADAPVGRVADRPADEPLRPGDRLRRVITEGEPGRDRGRERGAAAVGVAAADPRAVQQPGGAVGPDHVDRVVADDEVTAGDH